MKKENNPVSQEKFKTLIGGQALIEGIMMRGPEKDAIVVRSPEGLVTKVTERKFVKDKYPILGIPILRGAVTFISSMITGVKALMFSADYFPDDEAALVAVHDGARPFVSIETIGRCFAKAEEVGGAVPVLPVTDTLRRRTEGEGSETVDRSRYFRVQTPQVFDVRLLKEAYAQPYRPEYTDDASVYEYSGAHRVALVEGNVENIKLTTPFDLLVGEALAHEASAE